MKKEKEKEREVTIFFFFKSTRCINRPQGMKFFFSFKDMYVVKFTYIDSSNWTQVGQTHLCYQEIIWFGGPSKIGDSSKLGSSCFQ